MPRTPHMVVIALVAATSAGLILTRCSRRKPRRRAAGTQRSVQTGHTMTATEEGAYVAPSIATVIFVRHRLAAHRCSHFGHLALFGNAQVPAGRRSCKWADDSQVGSDTDQRREAADSDVLLTRRTLVKFNLPDTGDGQVSAYTLDFRGNALFDDDGDGVANEPCLPQRHSTCPDDGTEMSKMFVYAMLPLRRWKVRALDAHAV